MADNIKMSTLRVSATLDASGFVEGAKQKIAAEQSMVASARQVQVTFAQTDAKVSAAGDVLSRLARQFVDGYAAQQRFESGLAMLARGVERGSINMQQASKILDGMYQKFGLMADGAQFAARGQHELAQAVNEANNKLQQQQLLSAQNNNLNPLRLDDMRSKFDQTFAASRRMQAELNDLAELEREGIQITGGYAAALEAVVLKYDATAQAAQKAAQAQRDYVEQARVAQQQAEAAHVAQQSQTRFGTLAGIRDGTPKSARDSAGIFEEEARLVAAAAARQDQLRSKYDATYASQIRMQQELAELNELQRAGIAIAGGYETAQQAIILKYDQEAQAAARVAQAKRELIEEARREQAAAEGLYQAGLSQTRFNQLSGVSLRTGAPGGAAVRGSASVFEEDARLQQKYFDEALQAEERYAAGAARLRGELDPAAAAQERVNREIEEYNQLLARGVITQDEFNRGTALARQRQQVAGAGRNSQALGAFGAFNSGQQLQDIAVTAAMGQSIPTIALQQGLQLGTALEIQLANAKKEGLGLGKALSGAFLGVLSPINLMAIGLTAVVATAIQFGMKLIPEVEELDKVLARHAKTLASVKQSYVDARDAGHQYASDTQTTLFREAGLESEALQKRLQDESKAVYTEALGKGTVGPIVDLAQLLPKQLLAASSRLGPIFDPVMKLNEEAETGTPNFRQFRLEMTLIANDTSFSKTIRDRADALSKMAKELAEAQIKLGEFESEDDRFTRGRMASRDMTAFGAFSVTDSAEQDRIRRQAAAERLGIGARSPQELEAAARAQAEANAPSGSAGVRRLQIETAATKAREAAEYSLKEAHDQRRRSLDQTIESARLDAELVGKTTAEIDGLRMAAQQEADVRETAAQNHVAADEAEIARIKIKAAEYGKLHAIQQARETIQSQKEDIERQRGELSVIGQNTLARNASVASLKAEQDIRKLGIPLYGTEANAIRANTTELNALAEATAKANLQSDLRFEAQQAGRSAEDQGIAARQRAAGLPVDLNSSDAAVMRQINQIERMKDTWGELFDTVNSGIDSMVDALFDGTSDWEETLKKIGRDFARQIFDLAITNPLKNALTGANENTIADLGIFGSGASSGRGGGFGGILGKLFGAQDAIKSVASMAVTAAVVNVNGGVGGAGGIASLFDETGGASGNVKSNIGSIIPGAGQWTGATDLLGGGGGNNTLIGSSIGKTRGGIGLSRVLASGGMGADVNSQYAGNFQGFIKELEGSGYKIKDIGGYNYRTIAGTRTLSNHAYGNAIDINPLTNPDTGRGGRLVTDMPSGVGGMANRWGLRWGGDYQSKKDAMHFEVANPEKATQALERLAGAGDTASSSLREAGLSSFSMVKGLTDASGGLSHFGSLLSNFMGPGGGSGAGWFQGLAGIFGGAGGAINSMMGISPGATGAILKGGLLGPAGLYHEGGIAGSPGSSRYVSPSMFMGARRYHMGGLAGDEVPAILRRGEPVFRSMDHARQVVGANQNTKVDVHLKNINIQDPNVVGDYMRTDPGEKATMNVMRRTGTYRKF